MKRMLLAIQSPVWLSPSRLHGLTPQVADMKENYMVNLLIESLHNSFFYYIILAISGQWNKKVRNLSYGSSIIYSDCFLFPVVCPLKRFLPDKSSINIMERRSDEEEKILYYGEFIQISNP